ncbi:MAG: glycosyltransferase family 4 protein [Bacteriovoracia bacterium]
MKKIRKKVVIIQRVFTNYRKPLIELLKDILDKKNIDLVFIYGQCTKEEAKKADNADLDWGCKVKNKYLPFGFVWQPLHKELFDADLVIVEQANKLLLNYCLFILRPLFKMKIGFWGHGWCHQQKPNSFSNKFKNLLVNKVDWWFAYTSNVVKYLEQHGVNRNKITDVQNSIDTKEIKEYKKHITYSDIQNFREKHSIPQGAFIGAYCGGIYKEKQIRFLLESAKEVISSSDRFYLLVIGGGPDVDIVLDAVRESDRIIYVGPKFGKDKAIHLSASHLLLVPSAVGLVVLDSFIFGVPIITTEHNTHGPEFSYIENGKNGIVTKHEKKAYAEEIVKCISSNDRRNEIASNAIKDGEKYTIENMANNFLEGIQTAIHTK